MMSHAAPLLSVQGLTFAYRRQQALSQVTMQMEQGEIHGLLGTNGAGKSTLLKLLLGLLRAKEGRVLVFGQDMNLERSRKIVLPQVGSLIDQAGLYPRMSVRDYLRLKQLSLRLSPDRIDAVLAFTGLEAQATKACQQLSLGMRKRLALAFALLNEPRLLLLDEPFNGLDPEGVIAMRQLIDQLRSASGVTILLSSHQLVEVERLCDQVTILQQGRVRYTGNTERLRSTHSKQVFIELAHSQSQQAYTLLTQAGYDGTYQDHGLTITIDDRSEIPAIITYLVGEGFRVYGISAVQDLESSYLDLTQSLPSHG